MSLVVEHNFVAGVPQTILPGFAPHGICWHWTAGNPGRAGALQTINHFVATRGSVNASYHILVWPEHGPDHVGCKTFAMWIVPASRAAHSIAPSQIYQPNPNKDQPTQGVRIAEVTRILARDWDPNADVIAVSYCGAPGNLEHDKMCPTFVEDCRKINQDLAAIPSMDPRPLFGHGWIQPISRYEMDVSLDFIALLYQEPAPTPAPTPDPPAEETKDMNMPLRLHAVEWNVPAGTQFWMGGPGTGEQKAFTADTVIDSIGRVINPEGGQAGPNDWVLGRVARDLIWIRRSDITPTVVGGDPDYDAAVLKVLEQGADALGGETVEVPTGITQEQLDQAVREARAAGIQAAREDLADTQ